MRLQDVPDYLGTFLGAVHSACWFWHKNNLNLWADEGNLVKMTRVINGGTNGLEDRIAQYTRAMHILGGAVPVTSELPTLRLGQRSDHVRAMQAALGITADGIFGPGTERSLMEWQRKNGLIADGIAGPVTLSRLLKG
jgi:putative chitinase